MPIQEGRLNKIPEGWKLATIGKVCKIRNDLRKPISVEERDKIRGIYPYYGPTGILDYINEYLVEGKFALIGEDGDHFLKFNDKKQTQLVNGRFNVNNHAHIIESTETCSAEWFHIYFIHRDITSFLSRQGAGRYKLNKETLQSLTILIPPKREQIAIADLLSTWDKAIKVKDHLIEEKKRQKKWLMHNLLNDDWQDLSLGEICDIIMGQSPDSKAYNENNIGLPLIQGNTDCQGRITKPRMWTTQITKTCDVGDIILTVRAPVGSVAIADQQACIGRGVCAIRSEDDQPFIFQYLLSVEKKWARVSQGTTFDAISGDEIRKIKIKYPPPEERSTIANILSTADREIDLHEQHLVELKKQKKALMQLLLTGIVRVNAREVS